MSLDRRLRDATQRLTSDIDPDVDRHLHTTVRGARRRVVIRRAGAGLGVAAAIALLVLVGPRLLDALETPTTPGRTSPSPILGPETIAGTYVTTVDPGSPIVEENGLAGTWTFELGADGSMTVTAPAAFTGALEGYMFDLDGGVFRTNAFVNDLCNEAQGLGRPIGEYGWELVAGDLVFQARADACLARAAIFDDAIFREIG
jgi:hypothetical protein